MIIDTPSFLLGSVATFAVAILDRIVGAALARQRLKKLLATLPPAPVPPISPEELPKRFGPVEAVAPSDERVTPISPE